MTINQFEAFNESLLQLLKSKVLYSGNSIDSFKKITEAASHTLKVERASIWLYSEDRNSIKSMNLYEKPSNSHSNNLELSKVDFPAYFEALAQDLFINADHARTDSRTIEFTESYLIPLDIKSMLDAPIRFAGTTIGVICLEQVAKTRLWSPQEITYASSLADLVSQALEAEKRTIAETALSESEARYKSLVENIPDIIYTADIEGTITYVSPSVLPITGFSVEEIVGLNLPEKIYVNYSDSLRFKEEIFRYGIVKNFVSKFYRKDHSHWWGSTCAHVIKSKDGSFISINGIVKDISTQKVAQDELNYHAVHDNLTGLINRAEFEKRVSELLVKTTKSSDTHAMFFMDLDQFKVVNDTCGHVAGDQLLHELGQLLQGIIAKQSSLARLGGDEFGLLMEGCTVLEANLMAEEVLRAIANYPFRWAGKVFKVGVSIGVAVINNESSSFTELFRQADAACYFAKDMGRNRIHTYHIDDAELAIRHSDMNWVGHINQAIEDERFCLFAQDIVDLTGNAQRHYELLIRMLDEQGNIILPGVFLPAAERYNLMDKLDSWVVKHACEFLANNPQVLENIDFVTINLSGPSLTNHVFLEYIDRIFKDTKIAPKKVCFEVTETVAISNLDSAISFIKHLKSSGFRFALDDFGSGISSFGYLKNLPVDYLKIDGMFVKGMVDDPIDYAMVKSINEIGQVMGMKTIAEFVENDAIKNKLVALGVNFGQGYGLGKPKPLESLIQR